MKITETFNISNPGWLEYMANKMDILIALKTNKVSVKLHKLFNNLKESRILLHIYQDLMHNIQNYKDLGSVL